MATFSREPRLTLVGAGPGDPELITVKGIKALQQADAVLYDALVDESLLEFAPVYAEKIFVGKKPGHHSIRQEEINRYIVQFALSHGHVVRLKGGDPSCLVAGMKRYNMPHSSGYLPMSSPG